MSKYTVSKLDSLDKLSDNDLLLVSHDNGDGTYSSVNVPFSVIAEAIDNSSDSVGGIGNGTTDTINYFSPTTRAHVVESQFYDATTKSALLLKAGSHAYNYCNKTFKVFKQHPSSEDTDYSTDTEYKEIKQGQQIAGNLPLNIQKVTHTDIETETTTDYFVAKDLYDTCNKYTRKADLPEVIRSNITELTFSSGDVVYVEGSLGTISALTCSTFNSSTNLNTDYKIANKQRNNLVSQGYNLIIKGEYSSIRPLYQAINDISFSTYFIKPTNTDTKIAAAKNTPVYTDELTINDDSAVYIFGSFTCDATSSKGESYYFEIQICCENGDDDWFPIYRQYSTQPNANSRTTVNYQIFAKAGVKLRGYIAPQGSSNNVYYNLSNFSFTQCIVNGKFNNVEKFDIIQIPYLDSVATSPIDVEPADSSIKGYWITIEGAFSRHGAYAGDKDNSNNLYFATALDTEQLGSDADLGNFTPLHTVVLSTKNAIYSTYKYFIQCSSSVKSLLNIFASNKLGNNSNYSPYGSNSAKIDYSESTSTLNELLTTYGLTDSGNCTILSFNPTKNTPTKKISGTNTPYIAKSFNDSTNPSARIGVAQINQSSTSELYAAWKRDGQSYEILENATGATSLYWMPLNLEKSGTTYHYNIASSATLKLSNQINSFRVSSAKNKAQINTAKRLISVSKFGSAITSLDDYCFFNCTNLTSVASSNNITSIGESCFQGCTSLTGEVSFPNVTTIGVNAFNGCTNLTTISMSAGDIEVVPAKFAYKCTGLANVYMSNAKVIEEDAFNGTNITAIAYTDGAGSRFDNVTTIKKNAFANNATLTSVKLPRCESIGEGAFSKCTSLVSLALQDNLNKSIGKNAFSGCPLTGEIHLGNVTSIGNGAFSSANKNNAIFVIRNTNNLPTLKSINAFPNNAAKNTWKIKIPNETVRNKVATDKVWRQLKNRVVAS